MRPLGSFPLLLLLLSLIPVTLGCASSSPDAGPSPNNSSSQSPTNSQTDGAPQPPGTFTAARFAYAAGSGSSDIFGYSISPTSGKLSQLPSSPFKECGGGGPIANGNLVIDSKGRFLYANFGAICAYVINRTTGKLTPVAGSPFQPPNGDIAYALAIDRTGKYLYGTMGETGSGVFGFAINQTTGALKVISGSPFPASGQLEWLTASPKGNFLYVANNTLDEVIGWSINTNTGKLTEIGTFSMGGYNPGPIAIDSAGAFLYLSTVYNFQKPPGTAAFSINQSTGDLTALSGSPFAVPGYALTINSFDTFAYSIDSSNSKIAILRDNSTTGLLQIKSELSYTSNPQPTWLALDPNDQYLYFTDWGYLKYSGEVFAAKVNSSSGLLTLIQHVAAPKGVLLTSIAITP